MSHANGQHAVPPGFRFHPTDEELLYYYLRKKVAYEPIDLDVIRDVDLNKLEPWDLNDKCRIGTGPQNEWYFFSHKDKKYPTGTRTNRATTAGFWKATGRDKAIYISNLKRIGMRKTLVFYTGRAPQGQKTDWIMHEYRLDNDHSSDQLQEEGWVVCRVFKKKNLQKCTNPSDTVTPINQHLNHFKASAGSSSFPQPHIQCYSHPPFDFSFENTAAINMQLPQLMSTEPPNVAAFIPQSSLNAMDLECSHNLIKLTSVCGNGGDGGGVFPTEKMTGDWSLLDKLLVTGHQNQLDQLFHGKWGSNSATTTTTQLLMESTPSTQRMLPLQFLGCDSDLLKFCKEG